MKLRRLIVLAAAIAMVVPSAARANGDPASDVLLQQDVFFPADPPTSRGAARALLELTRRTRADGWPIKVALIADAKDLGDWAVVFNQPAQYADILAQELGGPRLLVVMPAGFGTQHMSGAAARALDGLEPVQGGGDRMARLGLTAVARLAAADGHRVAVPAVDTGPSARRAYRQTVPVHGASVRPEVTPEATPPGAASGGGGGSPLVYAAPVALIFALLGIMVLRGRLRGSPDSQGDAPGPPPASPE